MKLLLSLLGVLLVAHAARKIWNHKTLRPLLPWQYNFGKRRDTFRTTLGLLCARRARVLVETGVARHGLERTKSEGGSTLVLGLWARQHQASLHSVDIDPSAVERTESLCAQLGLGEHVSLHVADSVQFLRDFDRAVDFLYLDSFDYDKTDTEIQRASQQHHLAEFKAIEPRLHADSIVLIDDCRLPGGGKGKLVIDYMQQRGWRLHRFEYQALLLRG